MPRFFVRAADVVEGQARLQGAEFRHLHRALRLGAGDAVTLFDDAGREHRGVIVSVSPRIAVVDVTETSVPARESALAITLYQGVPKGRKMELVVEKATELGVRAIVPFVASFGTVRQPAAAGKRDRWERIALAAAKQSGRTAVPEVMAVEDFAGALRRGATADLRLLFWEGTAGGAPSPPPTRATPPRTAAVVVGPEGGFSRAEVEAASDAGFDIAGLGPRVLRTETAALVAIALVQARWGDLGSV